MCTDSATAIRGFPMTHAAADPGLVTVAPGGSADLPRLRRHDEYRRTGDEHSASVPAAAPFTAPARPETWPSP